MSDPLFSVRDLVVLVSGGSRGIGLALARGFAERGSRVLITGREEATLRAAAAELDRAASQSAALPDGMKPHPVRFQVCDVARADDIRRLTDWALAQYGQIDTLLNVAGVNKRQPAESYTEAEYDFIVDINLKGPFLLSQAVGEGMLARGQGSQINIVSLNNDRPLKHVLPYAVSKAGLGQMTRALALEWGPRGVRVNALAPGFILTDLTRQLWSRPDMQAWGRENTPLVRLGVPDDLIGTALFLASPASAFMTGQVLYVDGGFSAGLAWPIVPREPE